MRTVQPRSLNLNQENWEAIERFAQAFAQYKPALWDFYQTEGNFVPAFGWRERRDALKQQPDHQPALLPVHASDLAVKEAEETELKDWASLAEQIEVSGRDGTEEQKHYANWLLYDAQRFSALILGRAPIHERIHLTLEERKQAQSYLRRRARRSMKDRPRVRLARSFVRDHSLSNGFETVGGQGGSIRSLERGNRMQIPLAGAGESSGNIRVVLAPEGRRIEPRLTREIKVAEAESEEVMALDVGITEVFADDQGNLSGQQMGAVLKAASRKLDETGRQRNKLHALRKKSQRQGKKKKARNIRKSNLGSQGLRARNRRAKITIENELNRAISEALKQRQPKVIV